MQTLFSNYPSLRSSRYAIYLHRSHQKEINISCILTSYVSISILLDIKEKLLGYHNKQSVKSYNIIIRVRMRHFEVVITFENFNLID